MIRDPSDGSVRETPLIKTDHNRSKPIITSGLPTASTKPEQQARLEKSREWLKNYRQGKSNDQ